MDYIEISYFDLHEFQSLKAFDDMLMCLFFNGVVILACDLPTLKRWSHTATKCFQNGT